jgi:hypothetical protein
MRAAIEAVDRVICLSGASAVFSDRPLQGCFRDVRAANQHAMYGSDRDQMFGKLRLGVSQPTFRI